MPIVKCDYCGKEFKRTNSELKKSKHHFCCLECKIKYNRKHNKIIIKKNYAELIIISPKYGKIITLIDLEDVDKIKNYTWGVRYDKKMMSFYINCSKFNGKNKALHRYITNCPKNMIIDHINHNTLDNRKKNLKICTHNDNMKNLVKQINTTTNIPHICYLKFKKIYSITVTCNKETKQSFSTTLKKAFEIRQKFYDYFLNKYNINMEHNIDKDRIIFN